MAQITINEVSQNYTYNIGTNTFATVALPITSAWGPGFFDPETMIPDEALLDGMTKKDIMLEEATWSRFPATQQGLEAFVGTYRGPAANWRLAKDYSYQMAMTLLTAGYDVLVCRLNPGTVAAGEFVSGSWSTATPSVFTADGAHTFSLKAKYPGTFGNNLRIRLVKIPDRAAPTDATKGYWSLVTYVVDASGVQSAVENLIFCFDPENSTDSILQIDEVESRFLEFSTTGNISEDVQFAANNNSVYRDNVRLAGGSDNADLVSDDVASLMADAKVWATKRYQDARGINTPITDSLYLKALESRDATNTDRTQASTIRYNEWLYTNVIDVYDQLKDRLSYNPQRVISPGWDDQDINRIDGSRPLRIEEISPLHFKLMDVGYYSRCAAALIDIPRSCARSRVYTDDPATPLNQLGYAQLLARYVPENAYLDQNSSLYHTHSSLFAPWGQFTYVGTSKQNAASPSFMALMIQRAMILNQSLQFEWAMPTNRRHNLRIGKLDYKVPKKLMDIWQTLEGVGVNIITEIPDLGLNLWGNSTLYEVPPATYQALSNLSTRYLINAIANVAYRCGVAITFQYNNNQAYNSFYAGCTPILDTMKNVGAINSYYIRMANDLNGLDQVNVNTVVGQIFVTVNGVVNDIIVDLIALPPGTDLSLFADSNVSVSSVI